MDKQKAINILKKAVILQKGKEVAIAKELNSIENNIKEIDNKVDAFSVSVENKFDALVEEVRQRPEPTLDFNKEEIVDEITETVEEILTPKIEAIEQAVSQETKDKAKELLGVVSDKHNSALLEVRQLNNKFIKNHEKKLAEINDIIEEVRSIEIINGIDGKDGKDGSPDTGEDIVEKINSLEVTPENQIDAKHIKNLPKAQGVGGSTARNLYQLGDVNISEPANNEVLKYNASNNTWENGTGGSSTETFETVSKNLLSYPYVLNYTGDDLTSIVYTLPSGTITKTLNYTAGDLTSIVLSGNTPSGINLTKTLGYTAGNLTSITYS